MPSQQTHPTEDCANHNGEEGIPDALVCLTSVEQAGGVDREGAVGREAAEDTAAEQQPEVSPRADCRATVQKNLQKQSQEVGAGKVCQQDVDGNSADAGNRVTDQEPGECAD